MYSNSKNLALSRDSNLLSSVPNAETLQQHQIAREGVGFDVPESMTE
jgi:hypothetical protein